MRPFLGCLLLLAALLSLLCQLAGAMFIRQESGLTHKARDVDLSIGDFYDSWDDEESDFDSIEKRRVAGCVRNDQCRTSKPNASPYCYRRTCTFQCNDGFYLRDNACRVVSTACGGVACSALANGYNTCFMNSNGQPECAPQCNTRLGYRLYQNGAGSSVCVRTADDPNNCGNLGRVCPAGYGSGGPACVGGSCTLSCPAGSSLATRNGVQGCFVNARRRY